MRNVKIILLEIISLQLPVIDSLTISVMDIGQQTLKINEIL